MECKTAFLVQSIRYLWNVEPSWLIQEGEWDAIDPAYADEIPDWVLPFINEDGDLICTFYPQACLQKHSSGVNYVSAFNRPEAVFFDQYAAHAYACRHESEWKSTIDPISFYQ